MKEQIKKEDAVLSVIAAILVIGSALIILGIIKLIML